MLIPYFLGCLGMGGGGAIVYVTSTPFDAESVSCVTTADGGREYDVASASC